MATKKNTLDYEVSSKGLGLNKPQQMGTKLWAPMFAMALMAFAVGFVLSIARAGIVSDFGVADEGAQRIAHLVPAFMFIGFLGIFSSVSFAIARILGAFRKGGGEVQETAGTQVHTLKMPATAKVFMGMMAMGMMIILAMVVLHFVAASNVGTWSVESLAHWAEVLEGFRRLGVAMYLFGIAFGLGTIITVLRFQADRIRQLPAEARA
ncbi:MAG: hypothetical protein U9N84_01665 [Actinomycetota bacterium]|nr:hypothetical protein [Actinomycetota bacterium]